MGLYPLADGVQLTLEPVGLALEIETAEEGILGVRIQIGMEHGRDGEGHIFRGDRRTGWIAQREDEVIHGEGRDAVLDSPPDRGLTETVSVERGHPPHGDVRVAGGRTGRGDVGTAIMIGGQGAAQRSVLSFSWILR